ncbi:hypothetical protein EKO29_13445 [Colwellia sp. Arc7-635]|uniref:hypothetical protein n=1 Tax=Colwellia sp. Arc7-635 TaxID=2497879 RepID=UPI000F84F26E|nr:hypothetical protein [Colwellia sp. Arc7-635]AZQ84906.1 hypothetical protein EKO29_13445 [Colwellia sp. Arc7-635]
MSQWLLTRLQESKEQVNPQFAFKGAINWMRALSLIIEKGATHQTVLQELYTDVQPRLINTKLDTEVFESIYFAYSNIASLNALTFDVETKYDVCLAAIISWHDAITFASRAMIYAFKDSDFSMESNCCIEKIWQESIVINKLIPYPFNMYLSTLVKKDAEAELKEYRGLNAFNLDSFISNETVAHGGLVSYLKGTHAYEQWKSEVIIKKSDEFKALNVENFKKNIAKNLRDPILSEGCVNFLIQAERYRGKANHRDSLFLSYGESNIESIKTFIEDLLNVSTAFLKAASYYCSKRVEEGTWELFVEDIEENTCLSVDIDIIKV